MQNLARSPAPRPADEAEACTNQAAFRLWLAACGGPALAHAAALEAWRARDSAGFASAVLEFAGIAPGAGYAASLAAAGGRLEFVAPHGRWQGPPDAADMPSCIAAMLAAGRSEMLPAQAADHLLRLDIRPDERLLWPGPPGAGQPDPWPLGALLAGATLILCATPPEDPQALATAEGAVLLRRPA